MEFLIFKLVSLSKVKSFTFSISEQVCNLSYFLILGDKGFNLFLKYNSLTFSFLQHKPVVFI